MTRRIHLVRHGETSGESSIRFHGRNDVPLSDLGRAQVGKLRPLVAEGDYAAVVHSPLSRAAESAAILCAGMRTAPPVVEAEPALREIWFGAIEGMTREEIEVERPGWLAQWDRDEIDGFPEGDSIAEFWSRVGAGARSVVERHPAGDLLIVAHKGSIKASIAALAGLAREELRTWEMDLASLWELQSGASPGDPWFVTQRNLVG